MLKVLVTGLLACTALGGCATHRIVLANSNPTEGEMAVRSTAYLWGAAQERTAACEQSGINSVEVRQTFGNSLLSIVTLGIVNPIELEYVCTKPRPTSGSTDEPGPAVLPTPAPTGAP